MYNAFDPISVNGSERSNKAPTPPDGWGDPCLPWAGNFADSTIDRKTAAMAALFLACEAEFRDKEVPNKSIIACVAACHKAMDTDEDDTVTDATGGGAASHLSDAQISALEYFGRLEGEDAHRNKIRLMHAVRTFNGRILSGIKLIILPNSSKAERDLYRFVRPHSKTKPRTAQRPGTPGAMRRKKSSANAPTQCNNAFKFWYCGGIGVFSHACPRGKMFRGEQCSER
jgi:hypothetical protein